MLRICLLLFVVVLESSCAFKHHMSAFKLRTKNTELSNNINKEMIATGILFVGSLIYPSAALAIDQQYKLPPIDRKDLARCELRSSSMGQANAARDKLYDLRECDLKGQIGDSKDMSGMIAAGADFSGVSFREAQLSKAFARNSKFSKCDFSNAIIDRASFDGSDLTGAVLVNAVLSGTTFTDANLKDTDFTDSYLGPFDLKNLCANPTLQGTNPITGADSKPSAGCL